MWTQPNRIYFVAPLIVNPSLDQIWGEDVSSCEELMILFQGVQDAS